MYGPGETVLVSERSTSEAAVVAVELLFAEFGSDVVEEPVAVFAMLPPLLTCTVSVKVAEAFAASVAIVQVTVVVPLQLNAGPEFWLIETKEVVAGSVSVSDTDCASLGPAFEIEIR